MLAEGRKWLAEARDVLLVLEFRRQAAAHEHYLRQHKEAKEAMLVAAELRLRAERKLGELLAETVDHKGGSPSTVRGLPEGVNWSQSSRYQQAALVPEEKFEPLVSEARQKGDADRLTPGLVQARRSGPPECRRRRLSRVTEGDGG